MVSENTKKTTEQLRSIVNNVKNWKAQGRNYSELNLSRAIADGLFPSEMIRGNGIQHLFGGPVDISAAPASVGGPDTFLLLFSGVPNESCVKLAFPPNDSFIVYAGYFQKAPASEGHAKAFCTTGNMWFVAR